MQYTEGWPQGMSFLSHPMALVPVPSVTRESHEVSNSNYNTAYHLHVQSLANTEQFLKQGSGTFLAKGAIKPIYFLLYFRESLIIFFNT